jgi:hypothetical protein
MCSVARPRQERATKPPAVGPGLGGRHGTQQPTESRPKRWDIVGGGGAQGDHDGGGHCHIVSAVELGGKKINKTKLIAA